MSKDRIKERHIDSLQGWVSYKRERYYFPKCGEGYYPLDEEFGLSKRSRMSRQKEEQLALLSVRLPYGEVKKVYEQLTGFWVGRMTAHRTVQRLGKNIQEGNPEKNKKSKKEMDIDQADGKRHITADGTMVNIRGEGWKEAKIGASYIVDNERKGRKIIYAGTLKNREEFGEILYKASGKPEVEETEPMAFLGDGAEWLDNLKEFYFPQATRIVDIWHVEEHIWKLGKSFYGEGNQKTKEWAEEKVNLLREGLHKSVGKSFIYMRAKTEEQRKTLKETKRYFNNHGGKMEYSRYKAMGFHIGSGVAEGACKYVIQARFKQAGMRWSRQGAENLLHLRTSYLNNGFVQIPEPMLN